MYTALLRLTGPAIVLGGVLVIAAVQLNLGIGPVYLLGVLLLVLGVVGQVVRARRQRPRQEHPPLRVGVPVTGRWRGLNSPASKVPSHMHGYAQTYAIDITHEPHGAPPRAMDRLWPIMRRPASLPSFGQPVLAPFDGFVIRACDVSRDHLTRLSPLGLLYLFIESFVRSLGTPRHLLGNYVLIRAGGEVGGEVAGGGPVAVMAHLRRGSLRVAPGERVTAGQVVAECGNSGNSSDPHVHFQLMDGPDIESARGLPFEWSYQDDEGTAQLAVPADAELFIAPPAAPVRAR